MFEHIEKFKSRFIAEWKWRFNSKNRFNAFKIKSSRTHQTRFLEKIQCVHKNVKYEKYELRINDAKCNECEQHLNCQLRQSISVMIWRMLFHASWVKYHSFFIHVWKWNHWSFVKYHFFFIHVWKCVSLIICQISFFFIHVWKCVSLIIYQISFFIHVWKFFFTDHFADKWCTFHINDFVKLVIDEYAQIFFIYSQTYNSHVFRRVFVWFQHLETFSYMNEILQFQIFRIAEHQRIISLTTIFDEKAYFVKIAKNLNNKDFHERNNRTDILHCNWVINFLWMHAYVIWIRRVAFIIWVRRIAFIIWIRRIAFIIWVRRIAFIIWVRRIAFITRVTSTFFAIFEYEESHLSRASRQHFSLSWFTFHNARFCFLHLFSSIFFIFFFFILFISFFSSSHFSSFLFSSHHSINFQDDNIKDMHILIHSSSIYHWWYSF